MIKTLEKSARNENDAIQLGLDELGLDRDDVSVEIIQRAKSGFLGIGSCPAIVKLSYEVEDAVEVKPEVKPEIKPAVEKPVTAKQENTQEKKEKNQSRNKTQHKASEKNENKTQAPAAETVKNTAAVKETASVKETDAVQDDNPEFAAIRKFLTGLFEHMGVKADMEISYREGGGIDVKLSGSSIGAVIGRRGETLDAIQHLTNYAVNHGSEKRMHINVDAEGYRSKREESLEKLAEKMAEKALKYKRSMALEPMNSYERHVIHTALQNYEGVTTASSGEEPNRRVVVTPVKAEGGKGEKNAAKSSGSAKKAPAKAEDAPGPEYKAPAANKPQSREWA